jgi:uncharacterized membrane protein
MKLLQLHAKQRLNSLVLAAQVYTRKDFRLHLAMPDDWLSLILVTGVSAATLMYKKFCQLLLIGGAAQLSTGLSVVAVYGKIACHINALHE